MAIFVDTHPELLPPEQSSGAAHGVLVGTLLGSLVWAVMLLLAFA
jgi:hypothetical protein